MQVHHATRKRYQGDEFSYIKHAIMNKLLTQGSCTRCAGACVQPCAKPCAEVTMMVICRCALKARSSTKHSKWSQVCAALGLLCFLAVGRHWGLSKQQLNMEAINYENLAESVAILVQAYWFKQVESPSAPQHEASPSCGSAHSAILLQPKQHHRGHQGKANTLY